MPLDDDGDAGPERPPSPLDDVRKSLEDVGKSLEDVGKSLDDVRQLTDSQTLRALTHPVRIALIEALLLGGAMTATEVGERISESPTTCSFHLRQLEKYGFVEEAGGGKGRSRPWRLTATGMQFSSVHADPETEMAAVALVRMLRDRQFARYQTWLETSQNFPREWRDAAGKQREHHLPHPRRTRRARRGSAGPGAAPVPRAAHRSRPPAAGRGAGGDPHAVLPDQPAPAR